MFGILLAFFTSFIITMLIIRTQAVHEKFSGDNNFTQPQKFHHSVVPRIGGIAIALGILFSTALRWAGRDGQNIELFFILCAIMPFGVGLWEDITKKVSARIRFSVIALGSLISCYLLNAQVSHLNIPGVDYLLGIPVIAVFFTVIAITGLSNAYNIIDGFNGLSSMVGILTLLALGYTAFKFGDFPLAYLSITMGSAIFGFFLWNYPRGLIFLGDGGAYLIGFWIALISILITQRHSEISPWYALLVNGYPILETLFTIYRRKIHQGKSPGKPDGIHIHSLIFRRILNSKESIRVMESYAGNAKTSTYLWLLCSLAIFPAILFPESSKVLCIVFCLYAIFYIWLYRRIVIFKTPKWMHPY